MTDGKLTRRLSPRGLQVLTTLAEARGAVVSRAALMDSVWPDVHVGDESLTQAVAELRRAFGERRDGARMIETVQKGGYRLLAPVLKEVASTHAPAAPTPGLPLDAHLANLEAQALARDEGFLAAAEIQTLIDVAVAAAPDVTALRADHAVLTTLAALVHGQPGRLEGALASAERAVALDRNSAAAQRALGFVTSALDRTERARDAFERALALDPGDFETHYLAAQAFFGVGALRPALILAEHAADLDRDDYRPAYLAARAARRLGETSRATAAGRNCLVRIDRRLALMPDAARLKSARSAALAIAGELDEAHDLACAAPEERPYFYDVVALVEVGAVRVALRRIEALIETGWRHLRWLEADPISLRLAHEPGYARLTASLRAA